MKKTLIFAAMANIALAGCVTQETFVKNKMLYSDFERDRAACETKASQEVAVNRSPGAELAVALFTGVYQVNDANAAARQRNYESCMLNKGYTRVALPPCAKINEARENGIGPLNANEQVVVTPKSCAATDTQGRLIFHTQN